MAGLRDVLKWLWRGEARSLENPDATLMEALGAVPTASGVGGTPAAAMRLSAVSACVRLIAESVASLPLLVYRRTADGGRKRVSDVPQHRLLHDEPNPHMSSFTFRETLALHVLLHGNAYAAIVRNRAGEAVELLPVSHGQVSILRIVGGDLVYDVQLGDQHFRLDQADMVHVLGLSFDGIHGMSPIRYAAESIGLAIAAERFGGSLFGSGSVPAGVVYVPGSRNPEQEANLRNSWQSAYGYRGGVGGNKTAILYNGAKFDKITLAPEEAQFIETRKFQVSEIARWYRVPPHMIGDLERATHSNIEHQALEFVAHTLRPWLVRIEQELNRKLFPSRTDGSQHDNYCEFLVDGMLRGDSQSRAEFFRQGRQWGWLSVNDIRRLENMEPVAGGDAYLSPLNMKPAERAARPGG